MIILTSVYLLNYLSISNKIYSFYLSSLSIINSLFFSINFISLLKFSSDKSSFSKKSFSFNASFNLSLILFVAFLSHSRTHRVPANAGRRKSFHIIHLSWNEKKEAVGLPFEYPICFVSEQHKHSLHGRKHSGIVSMQKHAHAAHAHIHHIHGVRSDCSHHAFSFLKSELSWHWLYHPEIPLSTKNFREKKNSFRILETFPFLWQKSPGFL